VSSDREILRLQDIVENIDRIASHIEGMNYPAFAADEKTVDAVERCLHRITEAIVKIGPERMAAISPSTPVDAVRGMGNALRHEYDLIDLSIIWRTITDSLPALRTDCVLVLDSGG
jgi:uncharacterized protein with HEPN domain